MLLLAVVFGLLAVACGAANVGPGSNSSPTPSQGSGFGFDVTATEKDKAVTMRAGQKLEVILHGGQINWQPPRSSNTNILEPTVDPAATAVRGVTLAAFKALAPGEVEVTSVGAPSCPSGQPCPMYAVLYTLTVTITA